MSRFKKGPWRLSHKELTGEFKVRTGNQRWGNPYEIYGTYLFIYRRRIDRYGNYEERKEYSSTTSLNQVMEKLAMTDKQHGLMDMTMGGFTIIERLFRRFDWYLRREEKKDRKKCSAAYAKRRANWDERKAFDHRAKKPKKFIRKVEV